jgi:hypothetical protein
MWQAMFISYSIYYLRFFFIYHRLVHLNKPMTSKKETDGVYLIISLPERVSKLSSCYTTKSDTVMKTNPSRVFQVILSAGRPNRVKGQ